MRARVVFNDVKIRFKTSNVAEFIESKTVYYHKPEPETLFWGGFNSISI